MKASEKALLASYSMMGNVLAAWGSPWSTEGMSKARAAVTRMMVADAKRTIDEVLEALAAEGEEPENWRCIGIPWRTINAAKARLNK